LLRFRIALATVAVSAGLVTVASGATSRVVVSWPLYRANNANTGSVARSGSLTPATARRLRLLWKRDARAATAPVVTGGVVYLAGGGMLRAFRAKTGAPLWATKPHSSGLTTPAVAGGRVFAGGQGDGTFYAFAAAKGRILWSFRTGGLNIYSPPALVGDVVYFEADDGLLYALRASSGAKLWSTRVYEEYAKPAFSGGMLYLPGTVVERTPTSSVLAVDAKSGAVRWASYTMRNWSTSSVAVAAGTIYAGSSGGELNAFDVRTCASTAPCHPRWSSLLSADKYVTAAAIANGRVFVGADKLYALDAKTGSVTWSAATDNGAHKSAVAVAGDVVFVGSDNGRLLAFDARGCGATVCTPLWSAQVEPAGVANAVFAPAVADGKVFVTSEHGTLAAYGPK
jgi:outer membrane protein assembly factor BamB